MRNLSGSPSPCHPKKTYRLAPAKVNLMLHVVGKLPGEYHHLQSLVAFVQAGDQVRVEKADAFHVTVNGSFAAQIPSSSTNMVTKAVQWLSTKYPDVERVHVQLTKNLPVASGIGGGSSDAAATIAALLDLFDMTLPKADEEALVLASGEMGADVPMCLAHQFGWGPMLWIDSSGREALPVPVNALWAGAIVLANPGVPVLTSGIFQKICPPYTPCQDLPSFEANSPKNLLSYLKAQKNDLEGPAIEQEPKIAQTLETLHTIPGCRLARMSGSGATCFALFDDEQAARSASEAKIPQEWRVLSFQKPRP